MVVQPKYLQAPMDLTPQRGGADTCKDRITSVWWVRSTTRKKCRRIPGQTMAESAGWVVLTSFLHSARRRGNGITTSTHTWLRVFQTFRQCRARDTDPLLFVILQEDLYIAVDYLDRLFRVIHQHLWRSSRHAGNFDAKGKEPNCGFFWV